jgi:hypothetical protein
MSDEQRKDENFRANEEETEVEGHTFRANEEPSEDNEVEGHTFR